jgi:hypothetical protein
MIAGKIFENRKKKEKYHLDPYPVTKTKSRCTTGKEEEETHFYYKSVIVSRVVIIRGRLERLV